MFHAETQGRRGEIHPKGTKEGRRSSAAWDAWREQVAEVAPLGTPRTRVTPSGGRAPPGGRLRRRWCLS